MSQAHINVILADSQIPDILTNALQRVRATASFRPFSEVLRMAASPAADAYVIVLAPDIEIPPTRLRVLLDSIADQPRAVMILRPGAGFVRRISRPPTVPVCFFGGNSEEELAIRLEMMLEMRESLSTLHREGVENRSAESRAVQGYQAQLRMASQVQREFLPETPPSVGPVSFSVMYRPADFVSGDIYDIQQLDDDHIGIAIADATGHGIPAALLTVFVKRALRGTERANCGTRRVLSPAEVLTRLNHDLLEANLRQCQFVAAAYAVLNIRTLELEIARGGTPYPMLRRENGATECVRCDGGVVGIMPDAVYTSKRLQLRPGDCAILFSDGVDRLLMPLNNEERSIGFQAITSSSKRRSSFQRTDAARSESATDVAFGENNGEIATAVMEVPQVDTAESRNEAPADETLAGSPWLDLLSEQGVDIALDALATRHDSMRRLGAVLDDVTVVAIRIAR